MEDRLSIIEECINAIEGIKIIEKFKDIKGIIQGKICVTEQDVTLDFTLLILTHYPFRWNDSETIRFINEELKEYNHVNRDGSICIHAMHSPELKSKINFDFNSLRYWIQKYYINKETDNHYEHIILPPSNFKGNSYEFLFTEIPNSFSKGQFGYLSYSVLSYGELKKDTIVTNLIQEFIVDKRILKSKWSKHYQDLPKKNGIYYFSEKPPVEMRRFVVSKWNELEQYVTQDFLKFLHNLKENLRKIKDNSKEIPLLFGYKISDTAIHWQTILISMDELPCYGEKITGTTQYIGRLYEQSINWCSTRNCSYEYYFGRGTLHEKFTNRKILIIGVGAIGSMVATTLVRGGCKDITIVDHDIKEPENVCRSEYLFNTGLTNKVTELGNILVGISPFADIKISEVLMNITIESAGTPELFQAFEKHFDNFDLIIDCTANNDVAYILDDLKIDAEIINLSITNHARELVCAVKPNLYKWLLDIFGQLNNEIDDLYNPTGCWSPTFKASYNDISVLCQYAIKKINSCYERQLPVRNFYISSSTDNGFNLKLNQF